MTDKELFEKLTPEYLKAISEVVEEISVFEGVLTIRFREKEDRQNIAPVIDPYKQYSPYEGVNGTGVNPLKSPYTVTCDFDDSSLKKGLREAVEDTLRKKNWRW